MTKNLPEKVNKFLTDSGNSIENYATHFLETDSASDLNKIRKVVADIFLRRVEPYYYQNGLIINRGVFNFILEPLKNSICHGGATKEHLISLELFLSSLSLVTSYVDGGDYFTRNEVKQSWENKKFFPEKHKVSNKEIGFGQGTKLIYDMADLIYVDTSSGTLYIGLSAKGNYFNTQKPQEKFIST